jgi:curved DNA-binding protein CbpA
MARPLDPFRTLELPRDATLDEVKTAYRRLAKLYHPDSAGVRALPRFLAVQAAYEALTEGPGKLRSALGGRPPRANRTAADPWASRQGGSGPRATRAASGSAGPGARSGARPSQRAGATGSGTGSSAGAHGPGAGATAGDGSATGGRPGSSRTRGPAGPRPRRTRRGPGSTSYDGAGSEPFEPEWQGASWYGGSSGTYWTINPREFADPRKHGPDYLARGAENGRGASKPRRPRGGDARNPTPVEPVTYAEGSTTEGQGTAPSNPAMRDDDGWTVPPYRDSEAPVAWGPMRRSDVSAFGLVAAALLAVGLVAVLFAVMAEPTAPGTTSVVPVVAFCGVAIVALVRVLRRTGRPPA